MNRIHQNLLANIVFLFKFNPKKRCFRFKISKKDIEY